MKTVLSTSFFAFAAGVVVATAPNAASAACVGGSLLKGGFSVTISGQPVAGGTEGLAGVINSNGKCSLKGTLYGNINNQSVMAASVTGSYSINTDLSGTMTFAVAGEAARTFALQLASEDKEVLGLETDGAASATLDARAEVAKTFSLASLSGPYSFVCYAPGFQYQTGTDIFDGSGHATDTTLFYSSPGMTAPSGGTGTYTVGADGSVVYTLTDYVGNVYVSGGAVDTKSGNLQTAFVSANGSGGGNGAQEAELCVDKRQ